MPSRHAPTSRQFRILLDLDAPAVAVRQMPLQRVQLLLRHHIQEILHFLLGEEMPAAVQQQPAPREPRPVLDPHGRHGPGPGLLDFRRAEHGGREKLQEGLRAIEHPGRATAGDRDPLRRNLQPVALACRAPRPARRQGGSRRAVFPRRREVASVRSNPVLARSLACNCLAMSIASGEWASTTMTVSAFSRNSPASRWTSSGFGTRAIASGLLGRLGHRAEGRQQKAVNDSGGELVILHGVSLFRQNDLHSWFRLIVARHIRSYFRKFS